MDLTIDRAYEDILRADGVPLAGCKRAKNSPQKPSSETGGFLGARPAALVL